MKREGELLKHAEAMRDMATKARGLAGKLAADQRRLMKHVKDLDREAAILEAMATTQKSRPHEDQPEHTPPPADPSDPSSK